MLLFKQCKAFLTNSVNSILARRCYLHLWWYFHISTVMMMSNYYIFYEHFDLCNNHVLLDQSEVGLLCYLFWIFWIFFYLCSNLQQTLIGVREGISSTRYGMWIFWIFRWILIVIINKPWSEWGRASQPHSHCSTLSKSSWSWIVGEI